MKRIVGGLFLFLAIAGGLTTWWGWNLWVGPGPEVEGMVEPVLVDIPQGMTLTAAADTLVSRGLLKNSYIFLLGAKYTGLDRSLRAGLYRLERGVAARDLLTNITSGQTVQLKVTVAEGLAAEDVASVLAESLDFEAARFLAAADSLVRLQILAHQFMPDSGADASMDSLLRVASSGVPRVFHWCEGYLAPDTYLFAIGTEPEFAAAHLLTTQFERINSIISSEKSFNPAIKTAHELVTLASIVEAEARRSNERGQIAAVYSNRLKKNKRLEADPTVAYILKKRGKRMFYRDLEVDSPYNAYRRKGLPPGAIGNPGMASLLAAAHPDSSCRALFFVSDGSGGHIFSETAAEHEAAVKQYRRMKAKERQLNHP
ncbi:MAG: endolytic transglycosylase MltG [bacterium]|nr:endolytic transglycosylase MltG [bacterium]